MGDDTGRGRYGDVPAEFRVGDEPDDTLAPPPDGERQAAVPTSPELVVDCVVSRPLQERMQRAGEEQIGVVIELRVRFEGGTAGAAERVGVLLSGITGQERFTVFTGGYLTVGLTAREITELVAADAGDQQEQDRQPAAAGAPRGAIHRVWPNFEIRALTVRSIVATKCQAAHRAFNAVGSGVVWAVLDSGIDGQHGHWAKHHNLDGLPHRSFVSDKDGDALVDEAGHGTHVAGILAGEQASVEGEPSLTAATWYQDESGGTQVSGMPLPIVSGMAPACKLLSCKVLRADASGDITALLAALRYIQELNDNGRDLQVHGVNISVGHPFDPSWFAAGRTPVCTEVDRLVQTGVVVVIAAGNTGFGYARDPAGRPMRLGFDMTINDPGNAALALTVGSTSCSPHTSGVSYFSSKGPTGDGRMKPDLVAPGERVISAAAGELLRRARKVPGATYVENSGTSMAAPHVSGAAAAFLSVHREFLGRPDEVKRVLCTSATDLGRAAHFQGAGMLDAMRAIQTI